MLLIDAAAKLPELAAKPGAMPTPSPASSSFWAIPVASWMQFYQSNPEGLSTAQVAARRQQMPVARPPARWQRDLRLLFRQFRSPLLLLLAGAVVLSSFLGDTTDALIIAVILLGTSLLSFYQERSAGHVVEELNALVARRAVVLREGRSADVLTTEIVPGDVLQLRAGDRIPADALLIVANELHVNEASITGESYPVRKMQGTVPEATELSKRFNSLWEGTHVISGTATALVIHTGADTLFGNITQSASIPPETAFEKGIRDFGYLLMRITLVLSFFILLVNLLNHKPVIESALFALALAVGMAPELLPAIISISMTAGARRMLKQKVIVQKLSSIQNLGEINLLCTDKTGTLTEGSLHVHGIYDARGNPDAYVQKLACWNATLETGYANPIDDALRLLPREPGPLPEKTGEIPYDFIRKRLSVAVATGKENILISKGAFAQIVAVCNRVRLANDRLEPIAPHLASLEESYTRYGEAGIRCIGIGYREIQPGILNKDAERDMIFAGFILFHDPLKAGIRDVVNTLTDQGVQLRIITGDNRNIARTTAAGLGISHPRIVTGDELLHTSTEALNNLVKHTPVFAEVEPQQKERVIRALRRHYTVAYMGDGINDVSALNAADVGISVSNAVDVAREAADFVLLEKDLAVLSAGIREGRTTFANTLKYIYCTTGATFGNMLSVATASLLLPFLPMLPKQILLTNFLTDFPYLTVTSDRVDATQVRRPGRWKMKAIRNYLLVFGLHSSVFDVLTFLLLLYGFRFREAWFQTGWFIESVLTELCILLIIRTRLPLLRSRPGKYLLALSLGAIVLTLCLPWLPFAGAAGLVPLPLQALGMILLLVLLYIITAEALKHWFFKKYGR